MEKDLSVEQGQLDITPSSSRILSFPSKSDPKQSREIIHMKTYKRRFWILAVFSFLVWYQCLQWNTWGPLNESVEAAFSGWDSANVAMMANWGNIAFIAFTVPCLWITDIKGLRTANLVTAALMTACAIIRIIPLFTSSDMFFKVMCHISAIVNGFAGPFVAMIPPVIAAVWFPPHERTTATAFGQLFMQFGNAGSYLQPLIVRSPSEADSHEIKSDIARLLYIYAGIGGVLFLAVFFYFPDKPPTPPSISSGMKRIDYMGSTKQLMRNGQFLAICFSFIITLSVPATWPTVLNFSLDSLGFDQNEAMWVGFYAIVSSVFVGIAISRLTDILYGHLRVTLIAILVADTAIFYWFFLLTWGSITVTKWQVYFTVIMGLSLNLSTIPLFTEIAVERAYPCSELVVSGFFNLGGNIAGVFFLSLFFIPNIGYDWVTYLLLVTSAISLVSLLFIREDYNRTKVDNGVLPSTDE